MSEPILESKISESDVETGIDHSTRVLIAEKLGIVLADSYQLFIKTQGVHWNVAGPSFYGIHKLTEEQYSNIYAAIDCIAERIRALGELTPASYAKYGELSNIKEYDSPASAYSMIDMLVNDHETVCQSLRDTIKTVEGKDDFVTADMLTGRLAWHEEAIWMLRATIAE